jgi:hypothetical protein
MFQTLNMSKWFVFIAFVFITNNSFSQSVYPYKEITLDKPVDFKNAEPFALSAANFLLSTPFKKADHDRGQAFEFLIAWTAGDKDYNFNLQGVILELAEDKDLMQLFLSAMTKFCLENKTLGSNAKLIETNAVKTVLDYCNIPSNNFTLKKKQRKRLESN